VSPPDSLQDGTIVAIVGKCGTQAQKNKYEMCFEYSSFKPMFMKRGVIVRFLVEGDVAPGKRNLPPPTVSIEDHDGTTSSHAATCVAAAKRARGTVPGVSTLPELPPVTRAMSTVTDNAILTPIRRSETASQPIQTQTITPGSHMTGFAPQIRRFLTKVEGNELGDCPGSNGDDEEENT
jgi:hypothetical protein